MGKHPLPEKHHNQRLYVDEILVDQVEYVPIESLSPYRRHARKHPKRQLKALERGIAAFGFIVPVLVGRTVRSSPAMPVSWSPSSWGIRRSR